MDWVWLVRWERSWWGFDLTARGWPFEVDLFVWLYVTCHPGLSCFRVNKHITLTVIWVSVNYFPNVWQECLPCSVCTLVCLCPEKNTTRNSCCNISEGFFFLLRFRHSCHVFLKPKTDPVLDTSVGCTELTSDYMSASHSMCQKHWHLTVKLFKLTDMWHVAFRT